MADGASKGWSPELDDYVWTMVNDLLITSPRTSSPEEAVHKKQEEPKLLPLQRGQCTELVSGDRTNGDDHEHFSQNEQRNLFPTTSREDILEQINKIRKVLFIDQAKDILAESEKHLPMPMLDTRRALETRSILDHNCQEESKQTLLQELSGEFKYQLKQQGSNGEKVGMGADQQEPCEQSHDTEEIPHLEWRRGTVAQSEQDRLACQVHFLVHQLSICRQNLMKAEREVNMLHAENREYRSLIRDILIAFSGG